MLLGADFTNARDDPFLCSACVRSSRAKQRRPMRTRAHPFKWDVAADLVMLVSYSFCMAVGACRVFYFFDVGERLSFVRPWAASRETGVRLVLRSCEHGLAEGTVHAVHSFDCDFHRYSVFCFF